MPIDRDVVNLIHYLRWQVRVDFGDAAQWLFCPEDTPPDADQYLDQSGDRLHPSMRQFVRAVDEQLEVFPTEDFLFGYPLAEKPRKPGDVRAAFVVMPYSNFDKFEAIKDTIIDAGAKHNFRCEVSLDSRAGGNVVSQIWRGIRRAEAIVADLTGNNPNVFYEVGLAHALGKQIIFLTQDVGKLPFDVLTSRCITYDKDDLAGLGRELEKAFAEVPARYDFDPKSA